MLAKAQKFFYIKTPHQTLNLFYFFPKGHTKRLVRWDCFCLFESIWFQMILTFKRHSFKVTVIAQVTITLPK